MDTIKKKLEKIADRIIGGDQEIEVIIDDTISAETPEEAKAKKEEIQDQASRAKAEGKDVIIIQIVGGRE